ncbi:SIMPL domain-containing protein [Polyangium jinanense]|uniref:SIMPL domain-containing protein n=1 Tax=Polyangium jinanense TaxID=2829994 RepID=A0A9X3WXC9_9BACT|nr:SIMPL domain-containing protein [Polyangium jinanense]MDC3952409.1 SIMPL domain-containing protein [Polyangium jinanense]MDC3980037.1 SIMPL domain-containing protein [Polyangium jinanense]
MRFGSVLAFVLLVPASFGLIGCGGPHHGGGFGARASQEAVRHITVVGHGEAQGKPDIARTSLGVEASAPTVEEAMNQTNARMKAILDALKKLGLEEKDIQTANFSISIERPFEGPVPMAMPMPEALPATKGGKAAAATTAGAAAPMVPPPPSLKYRVSNTVEVTIRDVSKASRVVQAAVDAGANNVWNVNFGIDDTKALEATAREKAVADAKARAEVLAKLSGLELGPVISVSEVIGRGPIGPMPMMATAEAKFGGGPPLSMGEVTYSTSIEVIFGIKKAPEPPPAE